MRLKREGRGRRRGKENTTKVCWRRRGKEKEESRRTEERRREECVSRKVSAHTHTHTHASVWDLLTRLDPLSPVHSA